MKKITNSNLPGIFDCNLKKSDRKTKKFFGESGDNDSQRSALINMVIEIYNKELTQKQHKAFDYVYFKNMTVTEAAKYMGISQSSCSKLLKRGRRE